MRGAKDSKFACGAGTSVETIASLWH